MDTRDNIKSPPCKTRTTNGSVANEIDESERVDDSKDKGHKDNGYEAMKLRDERCLPCWLLLCSFRFCTVHDRL